MAWIHVSTKVDTYQDHAMPFRQLRKSVEGGVGPGWGGVSAMDGATELTWTYLQRPPQPDPPRHPAGNQPLLLLLPWPEGLCGAGRSPAGPPRLRM